MVEKDRRVALLLGVGCGYSGVEGKDGRPPSAAEVVRRLKRHGAANRGCGERQRRRLLLCKLANCEGVGPLLREDPRLWTVADMFKLRREDLMEVLESDGDLELLPEVLPMLPPAAAAGLMGVVSEFWLSKNTTNTIGGGKKYKEAPAAAASLAVSAAVAQGVLGEENPFFKPLQLHAAEIVTGALELCLGAGQLWRKAHLLIAMVLLEAALGAPGCEAFVRTFSKESELAEVAALFELDEKALQAQRKLSHRVPTSTVRHLAEKVLELVTPVSVRDWMDLLEVPTEGYLDMFSEGNLCLWSEEREGCPPPSNMQWLTAHLAFRCREALAPFLDDQGRSLDKDLLELGRLSKVLSSYEAKYDRRLELRLEEKHVKNIVKDVTAEKSDWKVKAAIEHLVDQRLRESVRIPEVVKFMSDNSNHLSGRERILYHTMFPKAADERGVPEDAKELLFSVMCSSGDLESCLAIARLHVSERAKSTALKTSSFDAHLRVCLNTMAQNALPEVGGGQNEEGPRDADVRRLAALVVMDSSAVLRSLLAEAAGNEKRAGLLNDVVTKLDFLLGIKCESGDGNKYLATSEICRMLLEAKEDLQVLEPLSWLARTCARENYGSASCDLVSGVLRLLLDLEKVQPGEGHVWVLSSVLEEVPSEKVSKFVAAGTCELQQQWLGYHCKEKLLTLLRRLYHTEGAQDEVREVIKTAVPEAALQEDGGEGSSVVKDLLNDHPLQPASLLALWERLTGRQWGDLLDVFEESSLNAVEVGEVLLAAIEAVSSGDALTDERSLVDSVAQCKRAYLRLILFGSSDEGVDKTRWLEFMQKIAAAVAELNERGKKEASSFRSYDVAKGSVSFTGQSNLVVALADIFTNVANLILDLWWEEDVGGARKEAGAMDEVATEWEKFGKRLVRVFYSLPKDLEARKLCLAKVMTILDDD